VHVGGFHNVLITYFNVDKFYRSPCKYIINPPTSFNFPIPFNFGIYTFIFDLAFSGPIKKLPVSRGMFTCSAKFVFIPRVCWFNRSNHLEVAKPLEKNLQSSVPAGTTPNLLTGDFKKENFFSTTLVNKGTRRSITFRS
jgi:hypothetical protein